jgi:hypothetical protein
MTNPLPASWLGQQVGKDCGIEQFFSFCLDSTDRPGCERIFDDASSNCRDRMPGVSGKTEIFHDF